MISNRQLRDPTVTIISGSSRVKATLTFSFFVLILDSVSFSVGVGRLAVIDVVAVQVGELGEELEDGFSVVGQVGHLAVKQVETLQLGQLFLEEQTDVITIEFRNNFCLDSNRIIPPKKWKIC